MSDKWMIYADRTKELLKEHGMTQRELAEKIGCTEVTMSRYLSGQRVPKGPIIAQTAKILHCSCDYLVGLSDRP